ncbi:MAG TPA: hypothetical protein VGF91_18425 [Solirubrobacteraceae bacterium]|jgi:hypothetical protein
MHSTLELSSAAFAIQVDGRAASLDAVFADFSEHDRLGVVVRHGCGAVGASTLILASVTAFYDIQRSRGEDFFIYPDYFLFHVGDRRGDHRRLDIWPSHKEVVVDDNPEALLRTINDRAITRLVLDDRPPRDAKLERESLASARARIVTALAYRATGRVAGADVRITGNAVTEAYVRGVLERSTSVPEPERAALAGGRPALLEDGRPVETYRRIAVDEALTLL